VRRKKETQRYFFYWSYQYS